MLPPEEVAFDNVISDHLSNEMTAENESVRTYYLYGICLCNLFCNEQ